MRFHITAALLAAALAGPAFADATQGTVSVFDPARKLMILTDRTVWTITDKTIFDPAIKEGDQVLITFTSGGENGIVQTNTVARKG
jgi:hypothetical protein